MFKPAFLAVSIAATQFATAASADNFNIVFEDGGFFPEISYLIPGDTVTFINETDVAITAIATDESWTTGSLVQNATFVLPIVADIALKYTVEGDAEKAGFLSFDPAPLTDVVDEVVDDGEDTGTSTN